MQQDIRPIKKALREKYRGIRSELSATEKEKNDAEIFNRLISFDKYIQSSTLLCFVSTDIEVDTKRLIQHALDNQKTVALPRCLDKNGNMDFFVIKSFDDLEQAFFGLLEPKKSCERLVDYSNSACILPGFAFDRQGFRIGYGKGYYDRFLKSYIGVKIGVCYNCCMANELPHGRFDIAADYIVTGKYILTVS